MWSAPEPSSGPGPFSREHLEISSIKVRMEILAWLTSALARTAHWLQLLFNPRSLGMQTGLALHSAPAPLHPISTAAPFSISSSPLWHWPSSSRAPEPARCFLTAVHLPRGVKARGGIHCCFGVILRCRGAAGMESRARRRRPAVVPRGTG